MLKIEFDTRALEEKFARQIQNLRVEVPARMEAALTDWQEQDLNRRSPEMEVVEADKSFGVEDQESRPATRRSDWAIRAAAC
jgi:hypothetical protein